MSGSRRGTNKTFFVKKSAITVIADPVDVVGLDISKAHCFAGVQFFTSADGSTPAVPTAGTVGIEIETLNNQPNFEDPPAPVINAATPTTVTWAANTLRVRATPAGLDVATHYQVTVTCNET